MLDTFTLRVVFAVLALCALLLFYQASYRPTRSAYAGWWCIALTSLSAGAALYLFNGTSLQVAANPMGNVCAVLGVTCVWASARSLLTRALPWWVFASLIGVTAAAGFLDDPRHDVWTGGATYLTCIAIAMGGACRDLLRLLLPGSASGGDEPEDPQLRASLTTMAVMAGIFSVFYAGRAVTYVITGPDSQVFETAFGSAATTLLMILTIVVAIFSMSSLTRIQYTAELRRQATHDGLTGLLNRTEFLRQATLAAGRRTTIEAPVLVVADVDRFKQLNDRHGHLAGDRALAAVGSICRRHLQPGEVAGRMGGDEFALVLFGSRRARELAGTINDEVAMVMGETIPASISFGVAKLNRSADMATVLELADRALYEAKASGGRRVVSDEAAG